MAVLEAQAASAKVTLDDKYEIASGRVFLTGTQALVRLLMDQGSRDRDAGLNTAGFVSGYRGSPLGGLDQQLWKARPFLSRAGLHFQPGLNEELAATAVWGTQQLGYFPGARVDGVFGMWYGKGPGVDRCGDVFRHANLEGTSKHGGVLVLAGDDHTAKSSTAAHQTEYAFMDVMIPVLNPANVQDILDFGAHGYALSRYSGCWVSLKLLADTVDTSASVVADPGRVQIIRPDLQLPPGGLNGAWAGHQPLVQDARLHLDRMPAVMAYARANSLDRIVFRSNAPRLGIVTTGKSTLDVLQAIDDLGLSDSDCDALGLSLYKVAMTWPLEPEGLRHFAMDHPDLLIVEERRPLIEDQIRQQLYNLPADHRPRVAGKTDELGRPLMPVHGELTPALIARALGARIMGLPGGVPEALRGRIESVLANIEARDKAMAAKTAALARLPYFCSGCPHNTSTKVPEGSRAMAGIGCHYMVTWMDRSTATFSQMGGEGVAWIGQAPFTETPHVFVNLGDGTYFHSGLLAIRAAVSAGVNVTYKILYNDAVAMTGGQPMDGPLDVPTIVRQVQAEGVREVVVVSDQPDQFGAGTLPAGVEVAHRDRLDTIQRRLRESEGCTVIVYEQTCAAEKRRRRKRGEYPDPPRRVLINPEVCEGCGDCGVQSNCVSIVPLETSLGRKRAIDQSSCNKDMSCVNGFCPSFVTVEGGRLRQRQGTQAGTNWPDLAMPVPADVSQTPCNILITGIGGTGVVTIGALLGMAAHVEGRGCSVLDMAGVAQKGGAVMSHVRIGATPEALTTPRIASAAADLVLGVDIVVASGGEALGKMNKAGTRAVINTRATVTGDFTRDPDWRFPLEEMKVAIAGQLGESGVDFMDATGLAEGLLGDAMGTNFLLVGYAAQKGLLPVGVDSIERAIEINGVAVEFNKKALTWGRRLAADGAAVRALLRDAVAVPRSPETLEELVEHRAARLIDYQDAELAEKYRALVERVRVAEMAVAPHSSRLALTVARAYYKLLAIKDEYEVARLYTDGRFQRHLEETFEGDFRKTFHLAPPLIARRDEKGHLTKRQYGGWVMPLFKVLARLRGLRGTPFDIFGYTGERKLERSLIRDFERLVDEILQGLSADKLDLAVELTGLAESIRGFGHVKERNVEQAKALERPLLEQWRGDIQTEARAA